MSIPYASKNKAEKAGVVLDDDNKVVAKAWGSTDFPAGTVFAHHPKYNLRAFGVGAPAAMEQIAALIRIKTHDDSRIIVTDKDDPFMVAIFNHDRTLTPYRGFATPTDALDEILKRDQAKKQWLATKVPKDGGEAYKQGFAAGDNPYADDGDESSDQWDEAWDAAADEDQEAEEDTGGSVVKSVYRQRYREAGHPNHCGDWLAETLNNLILGKTHTDIANFEALCDANGVSLAKYKHEGKGWEGRIRMTGRNLLAGVVFSAGKLIVPKGIGDGPIEYKAPGEWISAQNFKTKKQATVLAEGRAKQATVPDTAEQLARMRKGKGKGKK